MKRFGRMARSLSPVLSSLVMFTAVYGGIRPATFFLFYQPKAPKCLK